MRTTASRTPWLGAFALLISTAGSALAQDVAPPPPERHAAPATPVVAIETTTTTTGAVATTDSSPATAAAAATASTTAVQIEEVDQRARIVERRLEILEEEAARQKEAAPVIAAGEPGFNWKRADGAFLIKVRGPIHADGRDTGAITTCGCQAIGAVANWHWTGTSS